MLRLVAPGEAASIARALEAASATQRPLIVQALNSGRLGVHLTVEDDGPGVPPEAFARLMQPFERLEPSRGRQTGGTGLGLAIVQALARSQGGDLQIENRTEGGLRATLSLPVAEWKGYLKGPPGRATVLAC
jgi:signal transduction histidine kinase